MYPWTSLSLLPWSLDQPRLLLRVYPFSDSAITEDHSVRRRVHSAPLAAQGVRWRAVVIRETGAAEGVLKGLAHARSLRVSATLASSSFRTLSSSSFASWSISREMQSRRSPGSSNICKSKPLITLRSLAPNLFSSLISPSVISATTVPDTSLSKQPSSCCPVSQCPSAQTLHEQPQQVCILWLISTALRSSLR